MPVPGSGIPREWVDAAREALKYNRRPARAGHREWELSSGILRCAECGRAMSARTFSKPAIGRTYLYYVCVAGAHDKRNSCSARKHHKAEVVEAGMGHRVEDTQRPRASARWPRPHDRTGKTRHRLR